MHRRLDRKPSSVQVMKKYPGNIRQTSTLKWDKIEGAKHFPSKSEINSIELCSNRLAIPFIVANVLNYKYDDLTVTHFLFVFL